MKFQGPVSPYNEKVQSIQEELIIFLFSLWGFADTPRCSHNRLNGGYAIHIFICFILLWCFVEAGSWCLDRKWSPAFVSCGLWVAPTVSHCSQLSVTTSANKHHVLSRTLIGAIRSPIYSWTHQLPKRIGRGNIHPSPSWAIPHLTSRGENHQLPCYRWAADLGTGSFTSPKLQWITSLKLALSYGDGMEGFWDRVLVSWFPSPWSGKKSTAGEVFPIFINTLHPDFEESLTVWHMEWWQTLFTHEEMT